MSDLTLPSSSVPSRGGSQRRRVCSSDIITRWREVPRRPGKQPTSMTHRMYRMSMTQYEYVPLSSSHCPAVLCPVSCCGRSFGALMGQNTKFMPEFHPTIGKYRKLHPCAVLFFFVFCHTSDVLLPCCPAIPPCCRCPVVPLCRHAVAVSRCPVALTSCCPVALLSFRPADDLPRCPAVLLHCRLAISDSSCCRFSSLSCRPATPLLLVVRTVTTRHSMRVYYPSVVVLPTSHPDPTRPGAAPPRPGTRHARTARLVINAPVWFL